MRNRTLVAIAATLTVAAAAPAAAQQGTPATQIPAKLRTQAKISDDSARRVALRAVPGGTIAEGELEQEHGKLVYSYDIKVAGKDGVEEVQVDAVTGRVVSREHESSKKEAKEVKKEEKARKDSVEDAAERARKATKP